jgi:hypothetical protein
MSRKITDLDQHTAPISADEMFVYDSTTEQLKRVTLSALFASIGGGVGSDVVLDFDIKNIAEADKTYNVVFRTPFSDTNYAFLPMGFHEGNPVDIAIGTIAGNDKTTGYISVSSAHDDTDVVWIAIGRRS